MKVVLTQREMNALIESVLLEAGEVAITPKGRNIIGVFLMLLGGALTPIPMVGWVIGPTIAFLAKMGLLEDYVADYIEGRTNLEGLVTSIENRVMQLLRSAPKGRRVIAHFANITAEADETGQIRKDVEAMAAASGSGGSEVAERMAAIYVTDAILQMIQKNIKLDKLKFRGKQLKIPGKKLPVGGLITIDKQDLPARYHPLHGIMNKIADNSLDSAGAQAFEKAVEIVDNDEFDMNDLELSGDSEGTPDSPGPLAARDVMGAYDPDDEGWQHRLDDAPNITEGMKDLFDTVDMIAMINEIRYSR